MEIRRFREEDAKAVSEMIRGTLWSVNRGDYSEDYLNHLCARMLPEDICRKAAETAYFVAEEEGRIVGSGAVGEASEESAFFYHIFAAEERQGQGIGRAMIGWLEEEAARMGKRRVEFHASITAVGFYRRLGYRHCEEPPVPDEDGLYRMEKWLGEEA